MAGKWIVFEGLDGAGTTTQADLLVRDLSHRLSDPNRIFSTAEPTRGPFGVLCRSTLRGQLDLDRYTLALAFTADRSHHLYSENGILMHRRCGDWIVQDRYLYSTLAYQDGPDREWLRDLNALFPRPDLVVFLDTPVDVCLDRIDSRGKTAEMFEESALMERIARSYREVLAHEAGGAPVLVLDGAAPPMEIHAKIIERIEGWLTE